MVINKSQKFSLRLNENLQLHAIFILRNDCKITDEDISFDLHFSKLLNDAINSTIKIQGKSSTFFSRRFGLIFRRFHVISKRNRVVLIEEV